MEHASCNVIYVDRAVSPDRYIRGSISSLDKEVAAWETPHIAENVGLLLDVFGEGALVESIPGVLAVRLQI